MQSQNKTTFNQSKNLYIQ